MENMNAKPLESGWKIFCKRVPEWRERYLAQKNKEFAVILTDENKTPTDRFWRAQKRIEEEARILADCLDGHSRSKMQWYLLLMYRYRLVVDKDLDEFSDALREEILNKNKGSGGVRPLTTDKDD